MVALSRGEKRGEKRYRVYRLLLEGHGARKIAGVVGVSRQAIQSMAARLERDGILERIPRSHPLIYRRGYAAPTFERAQIPYLAPEAFPAMDSQTPIGTEVRARVHAIAVRFNITDLSRATMDGWQRWMTGRPPGIPMARTTLQLDGKPYSVEIKGRTNPILVVHLPAVTLDSLDAFLHYYRVGMGEESRRVVKEIVHRYGIAINPMPKLHQRPEIAFEDERGLLALSRQVRFRLGGYAWTDESKGFPEFETAEFEVGLLAFAIPLLLRKGILRWDENATNVQAGF